MLNKDIENSGNNSGAIIKDNSGLVVVQSGVTEKRVREIWHELFQVARKDFTVEAYQTASTRVAKFEETLVPKIQKIEGAINAFANPSFQFLLTSAQKTAASTDKDADYELLSELLVRRVTKGEDRKIHTNITQAVEVIDKIDEDALCALTTVHMTQGITPATSQCLEGIIVLQKLFDKISTTLPSKISAWQDHLEILKCIRINTFGSFPQLKEFYPKKMPGYFCVGIEKGSSQHDQALNILETNKLSVTTLVDHELLSGFVRLPIVDISDLDNWIVTKFPSTNCFTQPIKRPLSQVEIEALVKIYKLYSIDNDKQQLVSDEFFRILTSNKTSQKVYEWWNNLSPAITLTGVGSVIANANARRLDVNIPKIF